MTDSGPFGAIVSPLRAALERRGFAGLTAIQQAVLDGDGEGRNLRISSQTGSGKTVAIGLALGGDLIEHLKSPAGKGPRALIITPTRELAVQVRDELSWLYEDLRGLQVAVVTGGTDLVRERRFLQRHPQLVVGTPGRLLDHIHARALDCSGVRHVVLDEADRMLDMGFRDELDAIVATLPSERRSHLVSATFAAQVREFADRFQHDPLHIEGTRLGVANADIEHSVHLVRRDQTYAALVNTLLLLQGERCLVFVRRRIDASELAERLAADGFAALPFSGDLPQAQRTRTLSGFRNGIVGTLVATDVAARGIDVADIAAVVHMDPPADAETYTHRSGRTGRAGKQGRSVLLVPPQAETSMRRLLRAAGVEADWCAVPSPQQVTKALSKRARRRMHEHLESADALDDKELDYASSVLATHDPATVVARLLRLAAPSLPCEPFDVPHLAPRGDGPARVSSGYVRYSINWGMQRGANANRVIAHVCRRGDIDSRKIGAVDLGPDWSTFEVAHDDAPRFEQRVAAPDARDPHLHIRRATGHEPQRREFRGRRPPGRRSRG